jgi:hypothetical protein
MESLYSKAESTARRTIVSTCIVIRWERLIRPFLLEWAFLEQLAFAALDVGRFDIADVSARQVGHGSKDVFDAYTGLYGSPRQPVP